jgi:hypothetical protein
LKIPHSGNTSHAEKCSEQKTTPQKPGSTWRNQRKKLNFNTLETLKNQVSTEALSRRDAFKPHLTRNHTGTCQQRLSPDSAHEYPGTFVRVPKPRRRNKAVILFLLPVTILLWLIGWIIFYAGSQSRAAKPKPKAQTDTIKTAILLEEPEEYTTARKTR